MTFDLKKLFGIVIGVGLLFGGCYLIGTMRPYCGPPSSEGRNVLGAIVRGAQATFEGRKLHSQFVGPPESTPSAICPSTRSVPAMLPKAGVRSRPEPGDFGEASGWNCLQFGLSQPHLFRYSFRAGSGYLGPSRGLPDPGPAGFEAAAEAACFDGETMLLLTRTGHVDAAGHFVINEELHSTLDDPERCFEGDPPQNDSADQRLVCR